MAGVFTDVWKIVKPVSPKSNYVANLEDYNLFNNFSWNSKIMKGAGPRYQRYSQYKNMDSDVFVSRALDIIAAEMTTEDIKSSLPFKIQYQNESNKEIPANIVVTIRAALRHWCEIHKLSKLIFDIARISIKFGDCFFVKTSDFRPWRFIDVEDIVGVSLDEHDRPLFYQIKKSGLTKTQTDYAEIIPVAAMIHFSMSSGIGENGPFGISILNAATKAFRHLTLLEESVIIYRIVRAPERRVFSIDTGNMTPNRAFAYIESMKNQLKQKRVPSTNGGQEHVDSVMDPMSQTQDFWFMKSADGRGSSVDTLAAGENLGKIDDLFYFQTKFLQALRIPTSYMRGSTDEGGSAIRQDGKVGVAYMEELNFFRYVQRLQRAITSTFDEQFKAYLKAAQINIDHNLFKIDLNDPQNFEIYRKAEIDEKLMSNFNNIKDVEYIAARTKLSRYLCWSEDEIQMNEELLKQELAIPDGGISERMSELRMIYDKAWLEARPKPKVDDSFENYVEASKAMSEEPEEEKSTVEPTADTADAETDEATSDEEVQTDDNTTEKPVEEEPAEELPTVDDMKKTLKG